MAIVVSCPECQRKLKIAPTSIGKSVKCPCGNVFKAHEANEPPLAVATPVAPTTLVVACDNCQAKLKVPASARGRKMKCSKCSATFVVPTDDAPAAPPEWSKPTPPARSKPTPPSLEDDEPADDPRPAKKSSPARPPFFEDTEADEPAPARKSAPSRPPFIEDDEGAIAEVEPPRSRAKGKPAGRVAVATEPAASQTPAPASGCGGCVLSIFVLFIVVAYVGVFVPLYFFRDQMAEYVDLPFKRPPPEQGKALGVTPWPVEEDNKKDNGFDNEKKDNTPDKDREKKDNDFDKDKEKKDNVKIDAEGGKNSLAQFKSKDGKESLTLRDVLYGKAKPVKTVRDKTFNKDVAVIPVEVTMQRQDESDRLVLVFHVSGHFMPEVDGGGKCHLIAADGKRYPFASAIGLDPDKEDYKKGFEMPFLGPDVLSVIVTQHPANQAGKAINVLLTFELPPAQSKCRVEGVLGFPALEIAVP